MIGEEEEDWDKDCTNAVFSYDCRKTLKPREEGEDGRPMVALFKNMPRYKRPR